MATIAMALNQITCSRARAAANDRAFPATNYAADHGSAQPADHGALQPAMVASAMAMRLPGESGGREGAEYQSDTQEK
jgi:hypothetical protein